MSMLDSSLKFFRERVLSSQAGMWVAIGVLIGVGAGVGSLVLYNLIRIISHFLLTGVSGFTLPLPGGEGGAAGYIPTQYNKYLIPISTTLGGFLSGYMVYKLSPGSERLGINSAINAFHNLTYRIRGRTPVVKLAASAVAIGSGGSAGRDGPVALITAAFGSILADIFKLDDHDRRIVLASGIGAGIGSIFMAPIGGAIMSTEILYRRDFEVEALIPAITASMVGYAIFGLQFHYSTLFLTDSRQFLYLNASAILVYALIGVLAGLGGRFYIWTFDSIHLLFLRMKRLPAYVKPAIGGLLVGLIAIFFPQILGLSYGWVQLMLDGNLSFLNSFAFAPLYILGLLFFAKILATSFTIDSGGSGGVFAPSIVTGAFLGGFLGIAFQTVFPSVSLPEVIVVTMIAFFAASAKTPVSMLIMGTEMAGGLYLFLPLMIAVTISYFVSGKRTSIYNAQVTNRFHSPAHMFEYDHDIAEKITIRNAMRTNYLVSSPEESIGDVTFKLRTQKRMGAVIMDGGVLQGYITKGAIRAKNAYLREKISSLIVKKPITMSAGGSVLDAIPKLPEDPEESIVILDETNGDVVGTLGFAEIADAYEKAFKKLKIARMSEMD